MLRSYFSAYLLRTAQHQAALAGEIEASHRERSRFSIEHRAYVLSSLIASAGFLETMVNELHQDAADGHMSYVGPLSAECRSQMAELWHSTNAEHRLEPLEKYEKLLEFVEAPALDRGVRLYQDTYLVTRVRNAIVPGEPRSPRRARIEG